MLLASPSRNKPQAHPAGARVVPQPNTAAFALNFSIFFAPAAGAKLRLRSGPARAAVGQFDPQANRLRKAENLALKPWTGACGWLELERRHWTAAGSLLSIPVACPLRSDERRLARLVKTVRLDSAGCGAATRQSVQQPGTPTIRDSNNPGLQQSGIRYTPSKQGSLNCLAAGQAACYCRSRQFGKIAKDCRLKDYRVGPACVGIVFVNVISFQFTSAACADGRRCYI
jgi:hypothetical protein